jgi:hypothetical protein
MIKTILAGTLIAIGGVFGALGAFYALVTWGEWNCGINPFNLGFASAVAAVLMTSGNLLWLWGTPEANRRSPWRSFWPLALFGTFGLWLFTIAPACPFMSR